MSRAVRSRRLVPAVLATALFLAACGAASDPVQDVAGEVGDAPVAGDVDAPVAQGLTADGEASEGAEQVEGFDTSAIAGTAPDGSAFSLADYAGQQVFVETFATWCSNCSRQLGDTQQAATQAGDGAVFLALSVETDLDPAALTSYAQENGFTDLTFAVLEPAALAALVEQFGNGVLVPPSTPKFVLGADGDVSPLTTGFESVEEILAQLDA
jgi:thiol-disulfide isomerase/thioredoxin